MYDENYVFRNYIYISQNKNENTISSNKINSI